MNWKVGGPRQSTPDRNAASAVHAPRPSYFVGTRVASGRPKITIRLRPDVRGVVTLNLGDVINNRCVAHGVIECGGRFEAEWGEQDRAVIVMACLDAPDSDSFCAGSESRISRLVGVRPKS